MRHGIVYRLFLDLANYQWSLSFKWLVVIGSCLMQAQMLLGTNSRERQICLVALKVIYVLGGSESNMNDVGTEVRVNGVLQTVWAGTQAWQDCGRMRSWDVWTRVYLWTTWSLLPPQTDHQSRSPPLRLCFSSSWGISCSSSSLSCKLCFLH